MKQRLIAYIAILLFVLLIPMEEGYYGKFYPLLYVEGENLIEDIPLYPGEYDLTFSYWSEEPVTVEVYNERVINEDNTQGAVVVTQVLPAQEVEAEIKVPFVVEENQNIIHVQFSDFETLGFQDGEVIELSTTKNLYNNKLILMVLVAIVGAVLLWANRKKTFTKEDKLLHGILIGTALFASLLLMTDGIINGSDLRIQFNRLENLTQAMRIGDFPTRIYADSMNGFGYAFPTFYPDFFLWPFAFLGTLGLSTIYGYKLMIFVVNVATAYSMYFATARLCKSKKIGVYSSVLYMLSSYRLLDVYGRAALGETIAFAIIPICIYGVYELVKGDEKRWIWAALGFTGLCQSHMLSTQIMAIGTIIFALCNLKILLKKERILAGIKAVGLTVGLNLFFLIPILDHMKYPYNVFETTKESLGDKALNLNMLFAFSGTNNPAPEMLNPAWGNDITVNIGYPLILGSILVVILLFYKGKIKDREYRFAKISFFLGLLFCYFSTNLFPWDALTGEGGILSFLGMIQFPWRLLTLATFSLSIAVAYGVDGFFEDIQGKRLLLLSGIVLTIFQAIVFMNSYYDVAEKAIDSETTPIMEGWCVDNLYLMDGIDIPSFFKKQNVIQVMEHSQKDFIEIQKYSNENGLVQFAYENTGDMDILLNIPLVYDPNYVAFLDGEQMITTNMAENRVTIAVPADSAGEVEIYYKDRKYYLIGDMISLISLLGMVFYVVAKRKKVKL